MKKYLVILIIILMMSTIVSASLGTILFNKEPKPEFKSITITGSDSDLSLNFVGEKDFNPFSATIEISLDSTNKVRTYKYTGQFTFTKNDKNYIYNVYFNPQATKQVYIRPLGKTFGWRYQATREKTKKISSSDSTSIPNRGDVVSTYEKAEGNKKELLKLLLSLNFQDNYDKDSKCLTGIGVLELAKEYYPERITPALQEAKPDELVNSLIGDNLKTCDGKNSIQVTAGTEVRNLYLTNSFVGNNKDDNKENSELFICEVFDKNTGTDEEQETANNKDYALCFGINQFVRKNADNDFEKLKNIFNSNKLLLFQFQLTNGFLNLKGLDSNGNNFFSSYLLKEDPCSTTNKELSFFLEGEDYGTPSKLNIIANNFVKSSDGKLVTFNVMWDNQAEREKYDYTESEAMFSATINCEETGAEESKTEAKPKNKNLEGLKTTLTMPKNNQCTVGKECTFNVKVTATSGLPEYCFIGFKQNGVYANMQELKINLDLSNSLNSELNSDDLVSTSARLIIRCDKLTGGVDLKAKFQNLGDTLVYVYPNKITTEDIHDSGDTAVSEDKVGCANALADAPGLGFSNDCLFHHANNVDYKGSGQFAVNNFKVVAVGSSASPSSASASPSSTSSASTTLDCEALKELGDLVYKWKKGEDDIEKSNSEDDFNIQGIQVLDWLNNGKPSLIIANKYMRMFTDLNEYQTSGDIYARFNGDENSNKICVFKKDKHLVVVSDGFNIDVYSEDDVEKIDYLTEHFQDNKVYFYKLPDKEISEKTKSILTETELTEDVCKGYEGEYGDLVYTTKEYEKNLNSPLHSSDAVNFGNGFNLAKSSSNNNYILSYKKNGLFWFSYSGLNKDFQTCIFNKDDVLSVFTKGESNDYVLYDGEVRSGIFTEYAINFVPDKDKINKLVVKARDLEKNPIPTDKPYAVSSKLVDYCFQGATTKFEQNSYRTNGQEFDAHDDEISPEGTVMQFLKLEDTDKDFVYCSDDNSLINNQNVLMNKENYFNDFKQEFKDVNEGSFNYHYYDTSDINEIFDYTIDYKNLKSYSFNIDKFTFLPKFTQSFTDSIPFFNDINAFLLPYIKIDSIMGDKAVLKNQLKVRDEDSLNSKIRYKQNIIINKKNKQWIVNWKISDSNDNKQDSEDFKFASGDSLMIFFDGFMSELDYYFTGHPFFTFKDINQIMMDVDDSNIEATTSPTGDVIASPTGYSILDDIKSVGKKITSMVTCDKPTVNEKFYSSSTIDVARLTNIPVELENGVLKMRHVNVVFKNGAVWNKNLYFKICDNCGANEYKLDLENSETDFIDKATLELFKNNKLKLTTITTSDGNFAIDKEAGYDTVMFLRPTGGWKIALQERQEALAKLIAEEVNQETSEGEPAPVVSDYQLSFIADNSQISSVFSSYNVLPDCSICVVDNCVKQSVADEDKFISCVKGGDYFTAGHCAGVCRSVTNSVLTQIFSKITESKVN